MKIQSLKNDINVFYVQADSFPNGVKAAHEKLHSLLPNEIKRNFFGISYGNQNGNITYLAAAEESYPGEGEKYCCPGFTIRKGNYLSETINNWRNDTSAIGKAFQKMLADPRVDKKDTALKNILMILM